MGQRFWKMLDGFRVLQDGAETAKALVELLREKKQWISFAESCTGGLAAAELVSVPGASEVFECGFITYSDRVKMRVLGVSQEVLQDYTAVSAQTAAWMARGCRRAGQADLALSVTGLAGPGGGSVERPVGLVYIGCSYDEEVIVQEYHFQGSREEIRRQAAAAALMLGLYCLAVRAEERK